MASSLPKLLITILLPELTSKLLFWEYSPVFLLRLLRFACLDPVGEYQLLNKSRLMLLRADTY